MERISSKTRKSTRVKMAAKGPSASVDKSGKAAPENTSPESYNSKMRRKTTAKPKSRNTKQQSKQSTVSPKTSSLKKETKQQKSKKESVMKKTADPKLDSKPKAIAIPVIQEEEEPRPQNSEKKKSKQTKRKSFAKTENDSRSAESLSPMSLSPLNGRRRNGCSQVGMFLRSAPTSPSSKLSPASSPEPKCHSASPVGRRRAFFNEDVKEWEATEKRRDALCNKTDKFANERVAVRVLWKKF